MIQKKTRVSAALALGSALALAGCETVAESVDETYSASLSGAQEVPGPGDTDGSGNAEITVVDAVDNVCYEINVAGISPANATHIHRGATGVAGPPVVTLEAPTDRSEEHTSELQSLMRISYAVFCLKKKNRKNKYMREYISI